MRGATSKTPVRKQQPKVDKTRESSGKKMVQARLPFKVITSSPTSPSADREIESINSTHEAARSKDISNKSPKILSDDDVIMMVDSDDVIQIEPQLEVSKSKATCSPKTPVSKIQTMGSSSASTTKAGSGINTAKLQIKLTFNNKKRRKSKQSVDTSNKVDSEEVITESSDDTGDLVGELNPNKRPRVDEPENGKDCGEKMSDFNNTDQEKGEITITLTSDSDVSNTMSNGEEEDSSEPARTCSQNSSSESNPVPSEISFAQDMLVEIIEKSLEEAFKDESTANESSSVPTHKTHSPPAGPLSRKHHQEKLTLKQQMLKERRRKAREIKEQKLREEKLQKHREKLEKEQIRRRERDKKEEQKRKEREEKEEQKRKEREEKERKRLAEIETKNEEKRKRNEAKEEEQRKKDEERKRKEQEKVDAENKKKKAAEAFTRFFVPKNCRTDGVGEGSVRKGVVANGDESGVCVKTLAFRPFQIKGDMKLAPIRRKIFTSESRESLDSLISAENRNASQQGDKTLSELYLNELKTGKIIPMKWKRIPNDPKEDPDEDDVILVDELECAAQTIVEDTIRPMERYRAKFYKFYENRRPPYFGTWRKKTNVITPRRPLALDKNYFDYEVDSDLEWEEEEPGESLDGSDDDKEKESEDDDYEVDNEWFVPHGHLSEEEMQNDDDNDVAGENNREAQKAKLEMLQQEFAEEMKRKTEKLKPRLIGCIWQDQNGNKPESCPAVIWENLNKHAMLYNVPPLLEASAGEAMGEGCEESTGANTTSAGEKLKPISLSKSMLKDLIRIIHGNRHKKIFLIKEFIAYIEKTEEAIKNGEVCGPSKSVVRDKFDEFATWQAIDLNSINGRRKNKKKLCWVVSENILKEYDLEGLGLHNKWSYTLEPKHVDAPANTQKSLGNKTALKDLLKGELANKDSNKQSLASSPREGINSNNSEAIIMSSTAEKGEKLDTKANDSVEADKTIKKSPATIGAPKTVVKKRVPLLMSTARGQDIPTAEKNALISQFLIKSKQEKNKANTEKTVRDNELAIETLPLYKEPLETEELTQHNKVTTDSVPMEVDGVVVLD